MPIERRPPEAQDRGMNPQTPALLTNQGVTLIDVLAAVALLGATLTMSLTALEPWRERWRLTQTRAAFEADWQRARTHAQANAQTLRLLPLPSCGPLQAAPGMRCGWRWVTQPRGDTVYQTTLPDGVAVTPKPADGWQFDAWGDPLGGGASVLFQSTRLPSVAAQTLCLNVLGRLRRVGGSACND